MSAKPVIMVVDDSTPVREVVACNLSAVGYDVVSAASAEELMEKLPSASPDTILLDLILPDADGLQLLKSIRGYTDVPVIIISGKSEMIDKVVGLEMGADDYIGKPFEMKEVTARIKAQMRRYSFKDMVERASMRKGRSASERIKFAEWILDRAKYQVFNAKNESAGLTAKEFRLLEALVMDANRVLSRSQLLEKMDNNESSITDRAIDVQILRIRKKLGDTDDANRLIQAIQGIGYTLVAKTETIH